MNSADARYYKRYQIMKHMGWNLWDYQNCPARVITQIWAFMQTENKVYEAKNGGT
jgi:hypothetical protein